MNTTEFLSISSAIVPDRVAIISEGRKITFGQLNERANRLANSMAAMGVKKGDRVAIVHTNCNEYVEAYFATARLGGIFVPLNFRAKADELTYMLGYSESAALFVGDRYVDMVRSIRNTLGTVRHIIAIGAKQPDMHSYDDLIAKGSPDDVIAEIDDNDTTILMFTAGTTGRPKGVPLIHNAFGIYMLENVAPPDPDVTEVNLLTVPLYHVAGVQAMLAGMYGGRTLAMMKQFETKEWLNMIQKEKANRAMLVPTMLKRVIDDPDFKKYNITSLKVVTYGAAPMPFEVIKKAIEVMPDVQFINAFGQTETASTILMLGPEDHRIVGTPEEKAKKLKRLQSSIGKPIGDVQVSIMDEAGKEVARGETGEIVAKGPRVMGGYWKDAERSAKAIDKAGWLHTGDMGYMDGDGYVFLAGRGDDMIIRGGENISPEEVEHVLQSHPCVEECAVIGVADEEWGQQPRAVVVLKKGVKATAEEIMEHCRQNLSSFKRPRSCIFIEELPRNQMGKILKKDLRAKYGK